MKVGINNLEYVPKLKGKEIIYIFDKEPLRELLNTNLHCIHKDKIEHIDINLTNFNIPCFKKCKIDDDLDLPPKKDYKFAIIIPNYNNDHGEYKGKTFLQNCIESILNQTYQNFEIIYVDDMSTDMSVETVKSYKDKRIHIIQNRRKKYNGGSRNVGIEYALDNIEFDYFAFLDSDDWWKDKYVLSHINNKLYNHEMLLIGNEMLFKNGITQPHINHYKDYEDLFFSINTVWCTAWCRIIRKDKIAYFPEDTLMEDRVWSYEQADNINFDNVADLKEICYVWNRLNVTNSVSILRDKIWEASAWKHIGQQLMFLERIKHKEMIPKIQERIETCKEKVQRGTYQQY